METAHQKESAALNELRRVLSRHQRPLICYSGGKDSLVVSHMVRCQLGVTADVFSEVSVLFPEDEADVHEAARRLTMAPVFHKELVPERLAKVAHEFLPPAKGANTKLYFRRHLPAIDRHLRAGHYDLALFGRRRQENTVPSGYYRRTNWPTWSAHPLIDWDVSDVWAYLDRHHVWRPRCYSQGAKQLRTWVSFLIDAYSQNPRNAIGLLYLRYPPAVHQLAPYYAPAAAYLERAT
jgi:3'-phosphoadenosine 5'-phosphosulfate sulfotransferase (PAPS reductase)/FAD synthetase